MNSIQPEAHDLLRQIAASDELRTFILRLEETQRRSEEENWWNTDLGNAIEDTLGYLRMGFERAERR